MPTLTVVVPVYNEESSLAACVERVLQIADAQLSLELVLVDDGSTDRSADVAMRLAAGDRRVRFVKHDINRGKGAALQTGFTHATGDFVAVQDADLEYDPQDLKRLLEPLVEGKADVVLGSRFTAYGAHRVIAAAGPRARGSASATRAVATAPTADLDVDHAHRVHLGFACRDGADARRPLRLDRHLGARRLA